jgi:hypothetical protein
MQIEERVVNNVTILDLKGKITWVKATKSQGQDQLADPAGSQEDSAESGRSAVHRQRGPRRNRPHLHDREPPGRPAQARPPDQAHHGLLMITKLLTVFETFESEPDALKSYS